MHRVTSVIVPPVLSFDVSIPLMVFNSVPHYDVRICTARPGAMPTVGGPDIVVLDGLNAVEGADTVIAVGSGGEQAPTEVLDALRKAAAAGARIASLCTGAFVLAQTGLLDGLRATTHWGLADDLATSFPSIDVQPDLLFVEDGGIFTSAGAAAAIDLCLHLVRIDYGAAVANTAARLAVVPRTAGRPVPVHPDTATAGTRHLARPHTRLGARTPRSPAHPHRPGRSRQDERAHPHPALPRGDRAEPAPMVAPPAHRPGQRTAGDDRTVHEPGSPEQRPGQRGLPPQAHGRPGRPHAHGLSRELQPSAHWCLPLRLAA